MQFTFLHPTKNFTFEELAMKNWFLQAIRKKNAEGKNFMGAILGEPGSGKSALCLRIGELMNPDTFTDRRMFFSLDEFFDEMDNMEEGAVMGFDEAAVTQDSHFWRNVEAEDYKHITTMWRFKKWNCFYCLPDFSFLLKSQRLLTHALIIIEQGTPTHRYAKVHGIVKDYLGGSRTRWSDSFGETRELRNWPMPSPYIWDPYYVRKEKNFNSHVTEISERVKQRRAMRDLEQKIQSDMSTYVS
jgi:hypothetical protein